MFFRKEKNPEAALAQAKEYFDKAENYFENDDFDNAIAAYTAAISIDLNYVDAYFNRARAYVMKGQHDKAISDCSKVIALDPNKGSSYLIRGITYAVQGHHDKAVEDYNKSISLNSNLPVAHLRRGMSYAALGKHDKAIADYTQTLSIDPDNINAYRMRGNCYLLFGECDKAIEDLTNVLKEDAEDIEALSSRGCAYATSGNKQKALPDLRKACDMGDDTACEMLKKITVEREVSKQLCRIIDFMKFNEISISPQIQEREVFPFTMHCAKIFFDNFLGEAFEFDGVVRSMIIYDGKENLPKHSYAHGFHFSQSLDEIGRMAVLPKPIGRIELEYGGNLTSPVVRVNKR